MEKIIKDLLYLVTELEFKRKLADNVAINSTSAQNRARHAGKVEAYNYLAEQIKGILHKHVKP